MEMNTKNIITAAIVVLVVAVGGYYLLGSGDEEAPAAATGVGDSWLPLRTPVQPVWLMTVHAVCPRSIRSIVRDSYSKRQRSLLAPPTCA